MSCDFQAKIALLDFRPTTPSNLMSKLLTLELDGVLPSVCDHTTYRQECRTNTNYSWMVFFFQSVTIPPTDKNVGQIQIKCQVQLTKG